MGIEDFADKAKESAEKAGEFLKDKLGKGEDIADDVKDKVSDALKSDQAESISDKILDGAAGLANKVTGGKFEDQVGDVRDKLDGMIGDD